MKGFKSIIIYKKIVKLVSVNFWINDKNLLYEEQILYCLEENFLTPLFSN